MPNYILPQVVINQLFSEVALNTIKNQNCLVFGPNYQLFKYSDEDVRDTIHLGRYDGSYVVDAAGRRTTVFKYPDQPANSNVDTGYTRLFADEVVVRFAQYNATCTKLKDDESGSDLDGRIKFDKILAGRLRASDFPRDVAVGDIIRIKTPVPPNSGADTEEDAAVSAQAYDGNYFQSTIVEVFASDENTPDQIDSVRIADTVPESFWTQDSNDLVFSGGVDFCAQRVVLRYEATGDAFAVADALGDFAGGGERLLQVVIDGIVR